MTYKVTRLDVTHGVRTAEVEYNFVAGELHVLRLSYNTELLRRCQMDIVMTIALLTLGENRLRW
ncbi:hypothetical protein ASF79_10770 [Agreia sp. Leaf335]|nr:hypothetical protein ASF79_10770 [Agreia sp. Leaf335]